MKRFFLTALVFFICGFFFHAWLFPSAFVGKPEIELLSASKKIIGMPEETGTENLITQVSLKEGKFDPSTVSIGYGRYIAIINNNETARMDLRSDIKELQTIRPYGKSEQLQTSLYTRGTHIVKDTISGAELTIFIK
ncbi:MAG: hypothetical protein WCO06_03635 [Candidatus Roizmanbacteria bacterium]